jgi:riboflavin synthase
MFTGIITGVGRIVAVHALGSSSTHGKRLSIECPSGYLDDVGLGDSIALNGACMTVTALDMALGQFTVDISAESLDKTTGLAQPGSINLEKALRAHDRLGGHIVSGHVDGIGVVTCFNRSAKAGNYGYRRPRRSPNTWLTKARSPSMVPASLSIAFTTLGAVAR